VLFDVKTFISLNERSLSWKCPVCSKSAYFESLQLDAYFVRVLNEAPSHCTEVHIDPSGEWSFHAPLMTSEAVDIVSLGDSDDESPKASLQSEAPERRGASNGERETDAEAESRFVAHAFTPKTRDPPGTQPWTSALKRGNSAVSGLQVRKSLGKVRREGQRLKVVEVVDLTKDSDEEEEAEEAESSRADMPNPLNATQLPTQPAMPFPFSSLDSTWGGSVTGLPYSHPSPSFSSSPSSSSPSSSSSDSSSATEVPHPSPSPRYSPSTGDETAQEEEDDLDDDKVLGEGSPLSAGEAEDGSELEAEDNSDEFTNVSFPNMPSSRPAFSPSPSPSFSPSPAAVNGIQQTNVPSFASMLAYAPPSAFAPLPSFSQILPHANQLKTPPTLHTFPSPAPLAYTGPGPGPAPAPVQNGLDPFWQWASSGFFSMTNPPNYMPFPFAPLPTTQSQSVNQSQISWPLVSSFLLNFPAPPTQPPPPSWPPTTSPPSWPPSSR